MDDRKIKQGIRTNVDEKSRQARTLGAKPESLEADLNEVAAMFSQDELQKMIENGVLEGEWKSTKSESSEKPEAELPTEAELHKLNKDNLLKQAATESVEINDGATNKEIVEAILSGRK